MLPLTLLSVFLPPCISQQAERQPAAAITGTWYAVELRTAKGQTGIESQEWSLDIKDDRFRFVGLGGEGTGKVVSGKPGQLELVGPRGTLFCTFTVQEGRLTLAIWSAAADRQAAPSTERGGIVLVFARHRKGKTVDV